MQLHSPYLWDYALPALNSVINFAEVHLEVLSALGIGFGGWLAIRRWQSEQALKSWNNQIGRVFERLDNNLSVYHEAYLLMHQAHQIVIDEKLDGGQKKEMLSRIEVDFPEKIPNAMNSSDELQIFYSIGIKEVFDAFQQCLLDSRFNILTYRALIHDLLSKPQDALNGLKPKTDAVNAMFDRSRKTGLYLNTIQLLLAAMNSSYQDWLIEMKLFSSINFKAFQSTEVWHKIMDEYQVGVHELGEENNEDKKQKKPSQSSVVV